jgi:hypothetical protein
MIGCRELTSSRNSSCLLGLVIAPLGSPVFTPISLDK